MMKIDIQKVVKRALKVRGKNEIDLDSSFCIIDLADKYGVEVKFVDVSSMEGAYLKESKTILLSTLRPEGRIRFTCAHEMGHFIFNHGDHFDELVEKIDTRDGQAEEFISDIFASFLLMPETTIRNGFLKRGWDIESPSPLELYTVASGLGVGYTTIIKHMKYGLKLLKQGKFTNLIKIQPKSIKSELCGFDINSNLLVIDKFWRGRPADLQIGDYLFIDGLLEIEGDCIEIENMSSNTIGMAKKTGITRLVIEGCPTSIIVRVRKKEYVGRAIFRHLEEV